MMWRFIVVLCLVTLATTGALAYDGKQRDSPATNGTPSPAYNASRVVALVPLGPHDVMGDQWYEFDPSIRRWLQREATLTIQRPPRLERRAYDAKDAIKESAEVYFRMLATSDPRNASAMLALAPVGIVLGAAIRSTIGDIDLVVPPPIVTPLPAHDRRPAVDKKRLAHQICAKVRAVWGGNGGASIRILPVADARDIWELKPPLIGLITLRVVSVDLVGEPGAHPDAFLRIRLWAHYNRHEFHRFEHRSEGRPLASWLAPDNRVLNAEVELAVEHLSRQILSELTI